MKTNPEFERDMGADEIAEADLRDERQRREPRCPDCGEYGESKGHQTCQYPQD